MTVETCSKCGKLCDPAMYLVDNEEKKPLCLVCANRFNLSDEEWPPVHSSEAEASGLANTETPT